MSFWTLPSQMGLQTDEPPPPWQRPALSQDASALQAQMLGRTLRDKSLDACCLIIQDDTSPPPMEDE